MAATAHNSFPATTLGTLYPATSRIRVSGVDTRVTVDMERLAGDDVDRIAAAACDRASVANACKVAAAIASEKGARSEDAVYIIGPSEGAACKIGIAADPLKRMSELQCARPDTLKVFGLYWSMEGKAQALETVCLRVATAMGIRLRGEWVNLAPINAAKLIANVIASIDAPYADSAMWLRNRNRMVEAKRHFREGREANHVNYHTGRTVAQYGDALALSGQFPRSLRS